MSDVYNPEAELLAKLESLELEARDLVKRRDASRNSEDRQVLDQQLREVEERIDRLKRRFKR